MLLALITRRKWRASIAKSRRDFVAFLDSLPVQLALLLIWALGDAGGYLAPSLAVTSKGWIAT